MTTCKFYHSKLGIICMVLPLILMQTIMYQGKQSLKSILACHLACLGCLSSRRQGLARVCSELGEKRTYPLMVKCNLGQPLKKSVRRSPKSLKIQLLYYPARPLLSIYPKDFKSTAHRESFTSVCTVLLFSTDNLGVRLNADQQMKV